MEYLSPGDAFSSSLEQSLLLRAHQQRQAQMDQLAMQREARAARIQDEERQQAREALAEKRSEFAATQKEKQKSAFEKSLDTMLPGDIPSPDMVEQSKRFGLGHLFPEAQPKVPEAMPGIAAVPQGQVQQGLDPTRTGAVAAPESQQGGMRFIGSPKQRDQQELETKVTEIRNRLSTAKPGSPEERAAILDYEMTTNKAVPASRAAGSDTQPIARVDPKRQVVQRLVDGQWTDVTGDVPKGTHFLQQPDTSARDAAAIARTTAADDRTSRDVQAVREHGYTEFNGLVKGPETQLAEFEKVGTALNQRTAQADAELSVMFLKAVAGGYGSGLRMTKTEIENTLHGSTKWENLQRVMAAYSADPQTAPIPDEQREAMRSLAQALRAKAHKAADRINKARVALDGATSVADANKIRSQIHTDLNPEESETLGDNKPKSAADYLADFNKKTGKK